MLYLFLSLVQLVLTPLIVIGVERFKRVSQVFAFLLVAAITYNIFAHIIVEHIQTFGMSALLAFGLGLVLFSYGDHFFFVGSLSKSSWIFLMLLQVFLFFHAVTDGAALIDVTDTVSLGHHPEKLSQSVLLHRLMFEAFIWKYFYESYGTRAAMLVLLNIAAGTLVGFFASQLIFAHMPAYFDLFEAFMGGALFHLVYDYVKQNILKKSHRH